MNTIINRAASARKRLAAVKARGFLRSLREDGAIDLASIMVGVLVMGILGAVIAAAVFAVIPWSQDNAAKGDLDAVKTGESVQMTMSTGNGTGVYGAKALMIAATNASGKILLQDKTSFDIILEGTVIGSSYLAVSKSSTGNHYYISSDNPSAVLNAVPATVGGVALTTAVPAAAPWN